MAIGERLAHCVCVQSKRPKSVDVAKRLTWQSASVITIREILHIQKQNTHSLGLISVTSSGERLQLITLAIVQVVSQWSVSRGHL